MFDLRCGLLVHSAELSHRSDLNSDVIPTPTSIRDLRFHAGSPLSDQRNVDAGTGLFKKVSSLSLTD